MEITYGCGDIPLNHMRFLKFQKQASKGKVDPDRLPPTENATQQHALRAHHEITCWKSLDNSYLDPLKWGWEFDNSRKLRPKLSTIPIAPDNLLKIICCNCKDGERQCQTMSCSCMKAGMYCVAACGVCSGQCLNGDEMQEYNTDVEEVE